MSWRRNRRISPIFIGEPTLSWEYLPFHINTREEESLLTFKSIKCPMDLKSLLFINQLFIKKVSHTWSGCFSRRSNYKITDSRGTVLFNVVKYVDNCSAFHPETFPIRYNFYSEPDFKLVLTLRGFPGGLGSGANVSTKLVAYNGKTHLGEVIQENHFCDPIFTLLDAQRKRTFSIQGPEQGNCWGLAPNAEFNLCQHTEENGEEKVFVIGKLKRNYEVKASDLTKSDIIGTKFKWSVEFPRELDPVLKAMIVSGVFLIETQFF